MPTTDVQILEELSYEKVPIAIVDFQIRRLRNKDIGSVKVLWQNRNVEEMMWGAEEEMKSRYLQLITHSDYFQNR